MYREPERAVEAPVPVLAPVPTPVSAEAAAPQIGVKLPAQDQGSADLGRTPDGRGEPAPEDGLPLESQTSASGEGKPAPGAGVDEKTTSRGRKQREEASKETALKEKSGGKTAATREEGAKKKEGAEKSAKDKIGEKKKIEKGEDYKMGDQGQGKEMHGESESLPLEVQVPNLAPVPTFASAETTAPQLGADLPTQDQTSADRRGTTTERGKLAPREGGNEKIGVQEQVRETHKEPDPVPVEVPVPVPEPASSEARLPEPVPDEVSDSKKSASKDKSGGKSAAEDQATREEAAMELARLNQRVGMVIEAHRNMLADFFRQREMQRDALPDAEAEAEVERLGQIEEVKKRMLEAAQKIGRSISVTIREGVGNAGRGQCLFEAVSDQILKRKSKDGRTFQFLIEKYGEEFFTPSNLRAGTVALLENNPHSLNWFNWTPEGIGSQETLPLEERRAEFKKQLEALKADGQYAFAAGDLLLPGLSAYLGLNITLIGTSAQSPPLQLIRPQVHGGDESLCGITPPILLAFDDMALHYEDFWPEDEESESALMAATLRVMEGGHWQQIIEAQESTRQGSTNATTQTTSSAATTSTEKAAAEKIASERAAAERTQEEKAAVEKAAREKAGAERVAAEKIQEEKATVEKATAEEAARKKAAAERIGAKKAQEVEKAGTAEEAATEKTAAGGIVEKKALAEKSRTTPRATTSVSKRKTVALGRITVYKFNNPGFSYLCWINHPTQVLLLSTKADLERELLDVTEQPPHLPETRNLVKILLEIFTKAEEVQNLDRLRKILQASGLKVKTDGTGAALECFRTLVKTLKKEAPGSVQQFESITKLMHIGGPCPTEGCNGSILSNTVVKKKDIVIIDHKRFCDGQHIQHAINRYTKGSERGRKCTNNCSVKIKKEVEFTKTPELFLVEVHDQRVRTTAMEVMLGGFRYHPIAVVHHLPPSGPDGIGHHFSSLFDEKRNQWWRINDYGRENWRQAVDNLEDVFNYLGFLVYKKDSPQPHADWSPSPLPPPPSPPASQPGPVIDLTQDLSSCSPSTTSTSITG